MDSDIGTEPSAGRLISSRSILATLSGLLLVLAGVGWLVRDDRGRPLVQGIVEDFSDQRGMRLVGERWPAILEAAKKENLDPTLVAAVMWSESRGVSGRESSAGALGLLQLVPSAAADAARRLGRDTPSKADLLFDDTLNLTLGCNHLAWLRDSTPEWNAEALLVAYNTGRGRLLVWAKEAGSYDLWVVSQEERHRAGRPLSSTLIYARETLKVREAFRQEFASQQP